jgi:hypothetical protein
VTYSLGCLPKWIDECVEIEIDWPHEVEARPGHRIKMGVDDSCCSGVVLLTKLYRSISLLFRDHWCSPNPINQGESITAERVGSSSVFLLCMVWMGVTCSLGYSPKWIDECVKKYVEWSQPYSSDLTPVH